MKTFNPDQQFSVERCWMICRQFWTLNRKKWMKGFASVIGLLFVMWFVILYLSDGNTDNLPVLQIIMVTGFFLYVIGGLLVTSSIYEDFSSPNTAFRLMTLPATNLEKLLAGWVSSFFIFSGVVIASLLLVTGLIALVTPLILEAGSIGSSMSVWLETVGEFTVESLGRYVVYNSIFLLGAIYFRKNHFSSTLLYIIAFYIIMGLISMAISSVLGFERFGEWVALGQTYLDPFEEVSLVFKILSFLFWTGFVLLFLYFSYVRLENKQVA